MGKKAKLKQIRKWAKEMPVLHTKQLVRDCVVSGGQLYKDGVTTVAGEPVRVNSNYVKKKLIDVPVNHNRNMKKMYNKHGKDGVVGYILEVKSIVDKAKEGN